MADQGLPLVEKREKEEAKKVHPVQLGRRLVKHPKKKDEGGDAALLVVH